MKVTPTCRYGHGELINITSRRNHPRWAFVSASDMRYNFAGKLYTCATCGYTEFFDDEPLVTLEAESAK